MDSKNIQNSGSTQLSQVLANKSIDSATNTITFTKSRLAGININNLLNQALLTTSSPVFASGLINGQLIINDAGTNAIFITHSGQNGIQTNQTNTAADNVI